MLRRTLIGGFLLSCWALGSLGCLATRGANVPLGQAAPGFSLDSHDGKVVTLDALVAGGPAVLVFYRGHW